MSAPSPPALPPPRHDGGSPYALLFVCLGNICRSPMAEVVLSARLRAAGLAGRVSVASAGTGDWHLGEPMDRRTASVLAEGGYDPTRHRAQQTDADLLERFDVVFVMDTSNRRDVLAQLPEAVDPERVLMYRLFDPAARGDLDVPDPWYGERQAFDDVLAIVERTTTQIVAALLRVAGAA